MKGKIGDKQKLEHTLDAIAEIESCTSRVDISTFPGNSMMKFASIKQTEIIGESVNHITAETKSLFTNIEWQRITGMRHILVHGYWRRCHSCVAGYY